MLLTTDLSPLKFNEYFWLTCLCPSLLNVKYIYAHFLTISTTKDGKFHNFKYYIIYFLMSLQENREIYYWYEILHFGWKSYTISYQTNKKIQTSSLHGTETHIKQFFPKYEKSGSVDVLHILTLICIVKNLNTQLLMIIFVKVAPKQM